MIEVRRISKSFGRVAAVADVSFDVPERGITGLLGANGAGKTTTLKMLAGALRPDSGEIRIGTENARRNDFLRSSVGALLDHRGLYERLTARENLVYFAQLRGMNQRDVHERVDRLIADLGLRDIADRRTAGFSEGQRMKVALGRAIVHEPRHLLLDEPTNGLDVPSVRALRQTLVRLAEGGAAVLFSSHVLSEVESLCDRIVLMARGVVVGNGTPADLMKASGTTSLEEAFLALTRHNDTEAACAA